MSGTEIMDSVLKTAEKVASVDLEQAGKKAVETVKNLNAVTIVNAINPNTSERRERRCMARAEQMLDEHSQREYDELKRRILTYKPSIWIKEEEIEE